MLNKVQYYFFKTLSGVVCLLPYTLAVRLGRGLGAVFFRLAPKRLLERGIQQAMRGMEASYAEAKSLIRELFGNLGQMMIEELYIPRLTSENIKKYVTIDGLDNLRQAVNSGRGVVFLTAHIGNWEWLAAGLSLAGFPITTIVKQQPNAQYSRFLNEYREKTGVEVFSRGTSEMIKAARALKKGKVLGFLADQDGGKEGVFVDFLGKKASTPTGPAFFAEKLDAVVIPGFIFHQPSGGHRIVIGPQFPYERSGDLKQDIYTNTIRMTEIIEKVIKEHPTDWLWFQKRWNTKYIESAK